MLFLVMKTSTQPYFLAHMRNACPVVVPVNPCAGHLVEPLQLQAADLADYTVFDLDLDLGVVAQRWCHTMKASLKKLNLWLLSVSHCAYRAWHFECSEQNDRSNNADIEIEEEL